MYMGTAVGPTGPVQLYKHAGTRRYIGIDSRGLTYRFCRGRFGLQLEAVELDDAIAEVLR